MSDWTKLLLIEKGAHGLIRDASGNRIGFDSLEDMSRVTGIDFTGKFYVGYEPEKNWHRDSRDSEMDAVVPYAPYENLIDTIDTLKIRKADPLYGLSGQDLIDGFHSNLWPLIALL